MQANEIINNNETIAKKNILNQVDEDAQIEVAVLDENTGATNFEFDETINIKVLGGDAFRLSAEEPYSAQNAEDFPGENFELNENYAVFLAEGDDLDFALNDEEMAEITPFQNEIPQHVFENTLSNKFCTKCCLSKCFDRIFPLREILVSAVVTCKGYPLAGVRVKIAGEHTKSVVTGKNGRFSTRIVVCDQVSFTACQKYRCLSRTIFFPEQSETVNFNFT